MKRFTFVCFGLAFASVMSAQEVPRFAFDVAGYVPVSFGFRW
jgi:hypothetical protein